MEQVNNLYQQWLAHCSDPALHADLLSAGGNEAEITDRFYRTLSFGTAGLRGVLGAGTNRMNLYTVGAATQGLAGYLCEKYAAASVAIAYDSRHNSKLFAETAAAILAANGIHVWLYRELMPTPALSFAIMHLHCQSGIVITASHNPAKYNGYKVYGEDASQISPEVAADIEKRICAIDYWTGIAKGTLEEGLASGKIKYIPEETVEAYLCAVLSEQVDPGVCRRVPLSVVYTAPATAVYAPF